MTVTTVPKRRCVMERVRGRDQQVIAELWHACLGDGGADFRRIICDPGLDGINLPGPSIVREPTCPACLKALTPERPRAKTAAVIALGDAVTQARNAGLSATFIHNVVVSCLENPVPDIEETIG